MSDYTYTDKDGDKLLIASYQMGESLVQVEQAGGNWGIRVANADAPTIAAELLKAAGQEGTFIPKAYEEVERLGDELTCGGIASRVLSPITANPNWLRKKAANCIAIAEYIENKEQRETEAAQKIQERRDAIALYIMRNDDDLPVGDYASLTWYAQKAVDRIIELEDRK